MSKRPEPGTASPLGATLSNGGVNFSVFAEKATAVELLLFDDGRCPSTGAGASGSIRRGTAPTITGTSSCPDLRPGQIYAYRADGPNAPELGLRFDPEKVLLDPYGRAVAVPANYSRAAASASRRQRSDAP